MDLAEYLILVFFLLLATMPIWILLVWKRKKKQSRLRREEFPSMDYPVPWMGSAGSENLRHGGNGSSLIVEDSKGV